MNKDILGKKEVQSNSTDTDSLDWLKDYEEVKNHLYVRLISKKIAKDLNDIPHEFITNDIVVTYGVLWYSGGKNVMIFTVNNELLHNTWNVRDEQLKLDAIKSSMDLFPADFLTIKNGKYEDGTYTRLPVSDGIIITNIHRINGASVLLYPGALDTLSDIMGGPIVIIPLSTNEILAMPFEGCTFTESQLQYLNSSLKDKNKFLSNHIYVYDPEYEKLETKEHYLKRNYKS